MKTFKPNQRVTWQMPVADPARGAPAVVPIRRVTQHGSVVDYSNTTVTVREQRSGEVLELPIQMVQG